MDPLNFNASQSAILLLQSYHLHVRTWLEGASSTSSDGNSWYKLAAPWTLTIPLLFTLCLRWLFTRLYEENHDLSIVNRSFALEPGVLARFRWAFRAVDILETAQQKFKNQPFRLARGDANFIVLPSEFITELNVLPPRVVNSRIAHSFTLLGHLNGIDVVTKTHSHVKGLLHSITPALPRLQKPICQRIDETITELFPQDTKTWMTIKPLDHILYCVSRSLALTISGPPMCDDPEFIRLCHEHTEKIFTLALSMRMIPNFLQPALVWLHPVKWRLRSSWKKVESYVVPEVSRCVEKNSRGELPNLIAWLVDEAKNKRCVDSHTITELVGALMAGGTWSTAMTITAVLLDLVAHPHFLEEIREEIRTKHRECNGEWNISTFNSLDKLDSAMKETMRMAPGALLIYSRVMTSDYTLSNGLRLTKGQRICVSGRTRATNPTLFPDPHTYDALRAYNKDLQAHRKTPFRSLDHEDYRWGAGRWACPGRYIANLTGKALLVQLLDEYEFQLVGDQPAKSLTLHEFVFLDPSTTMKVRRREVNSGICH